MNPELPESCLPGWSGQLCKHTYDSLGFRGGLGFRGVLGLGFRVPRVMGGYMGVSQN